MNNGILIKFVIFIARVSVIGTRGMLRKFFISVLRILTRESANIKININKVPFIIYFDTDFKAIFENYNLREINFLIRNLEKEGAFIDIGANYGYYSQTLSYHNLVNKIIAIEPNKKFLPRIQDNFSLLLNQKKNISPMAKWLWWSSVRESPVCSWPANLPNRNACCCWNRVPTSAEDAARGTRETVRACFTKRGRGASTRTM